MTILRALNWAALLGWSALLSLLLTQGPSHTFIPNLALALQTYCVAELALIAANVISGNLALGVPLHYTRMLILLLAFPLASPLVQSAILLAWALTELCRYLMFLSSSPYARTARYVMPVFTFPLGAGAEAMAAFTALPFLSGAAYYATAAVIPANTIGGAIAYQGLLGKARKALKKSD